MNCGRHGFAPAHARERGPAAGHQCSRPRRGSRLLCKPSRLKRQIKPHKVALLSGTPLTPSSSLPKMAEVLCCLPRGLRYEFTLAAAAEPELLRIISVEPGPEKSRCTRRQKSKKPGRDEPRAITERLI